MRILARALIPFIFTTLAVVAEEPARPAVELRLKHGDDPRWAARDWDDREWELLGPPKEYGAGDLPGRAGVYWVRVRLERTSRRMGRPVMEPFVWPRDEPGSPINSVFLPAVFAYELYWDGRLIGRSGVVGVSREAEVAGPLDNLIMIPAELLGPGPHVAALRMSSYHYNFRSPTFAMYFALENYTARLISETWQPIYPMIGAGSAALAAAICVVLFWFVDRRRPLLLCSAVGIALAVFYLLIAWRWLHNDPYDWLAPRYAAIDGVMTLISLLLPWLLLEQFAVPGRVWWLLTLTPALVAAWTGSTFAWDKAVWMCRAMLGFSLVVAGWAVWRRRTGARFALAGVLIGLAGVRAVDRGFLGPSFFLAFGGTGLGVLVAIGSQVQADRRRAQEARLTSARLELELLKKNLQPHFLLNTLATIVEVVEQEPKTAVTLIEALAREFRILARVAGEKLIPLGHELELCRAHLRIMSLRKGARCSLTVAADADERALVPPALFHTLVENGLTHLLPRDGEQRFELSATRDAGRVRYTLVAHGEPMERERPATFAPLNVTAPPVAAKPVARREGTGLRYIKARLEESFPGRWRLHGEEIAEGWRTVIEIEGVESLRTLEIGRSP
jgi:hypothetical protein